MSVCLSALVPGVVRLDLSEVMRSADSNEPLYAHPHQQVDADTEGDPETPH